MSQTITIKPFEAYASLSDEEVVTSGTAVQSKMTGNPEFTNSPVDLAVLKTDIDTLSALIAEAKDGSKKVIAEKNKQRRVVVKKLRLLGRYVEVTADNDMAKFQSSGFQPVVINRSASPSLSQNVRSLDHGANSGEIVVRLKADPEALSHELRFAAENNGAAPVWTTQLVTRVKAPITLRGLTPGTIYAFQVRSMTPSGYTDWSDSITLMST